jgi:hypothetical protein
VLTLDDENDDGVDAADAATLRQADQRRASIARSPARRGSWDGDGHAHEPLQCTIRTP